MRQPGLMPTWIKPVGAAVGWPFRLDREAGFCATLELERRAGTCHTASIILGLVLAWTSVTVCAYYSQRSVFFRCAQKIGYQLSALPCVPTTGRKRKGLGGCLHRFSSTRPDSAQLSHHRYLSTLGSSPKGRTTESLEALQMSLWNVWIHKRHRNHGSRSVTQTRDVWFS